MRLLLEYGADAHVVHHGNYHAEEPVEPRSHVTNAVMAATGMGGGVAWVQPDRREREALMLEAVRIAVEQGIDVNAVNTNGRIRARCRARPEVRARGHVPRRARRPARDEPA